jgi:hypothetical protein
MKLQVHIRYSEMKPPFVAHLPRECYRIQWGKDCILGEKTMYLKGRNSGLCYGGLLRPRDHGHSA